MINIVEIQKLAQQFEEAAKTQRTPFSPEEASDEWLNAPTKAPVSHDIDLSELGEYPEEEDLDPWNIRERKPSNENQEAPTSFKRKCFELGKLFSEIKNIATQTSNACSFGDFDDIASSEIGGVPFAREEIERLLLIVESIYEDLY